MLTLALVLALHACPQRIVVTAPSTRSTTASLSLLECNRRVAGPFRARVGLRRALGAPPRRRRHDAARDVRDRPDRSTGSTPTPGSASPTTACAAATGGTATRRRRRTTTSATSAVRRRAAVCRAERAALAQPGRLPRVRVHRVQRRAGGARAAARRSSCTTTSATRRTAASACRGRGCSRLLRRLRPGATITISA